MAGLIDTGFPGQFEDLRAAMEMVGLSVDKLKVVILTHQDVDHIGNLPEILQERSSCPYHTGYRSSPSLVEKVFGL